MSAQPDNTSAATNIVNAVVTAVAATQQPQRGEWSEQKRAAFVALAPQLTQLVNAIDEYLKGKEVTS